ncbi:hypothetical protein [Actinoplanes utahensis]|uniref:Uncharacterized protein n=1 Tax=Actinoplanes utahensis TaxID=1869 RepID=A0A0A6UHD3_ACTUT|nr:hypothetical protein [Actinoplanes utahensis]KHD74826.1 hypothetical protein MB27_26125 [Actinoplanes utahensis]GIF30815.1 hypothetical protein Aut01nite_38010 [Actinoplanes utahensis]
MTLTVANPIYDLRCGRDHSTLRTAPGIIRAMTTALGDWATLLDVDDGTCGRGFEPWIVPPVAA